MQEHAGTSFTGDCWGRADDDAGRRVFPIYQEQQLFPSGTVSSMEPRRPDICSRQWISLNRDSQFHLLEGCCFCYILCFSDTVFDELQSHALPLCCKTYGIYYSKSATRENLSTDHENVKLGS